MSADSEDSIYLFTQPCFESTSMRRLWAHICKVHWMTMSMYAKWMTVSVLERGGRGERRRRGDGVREEAGGRAEGGWVRDRWSPRLPGQPMPYKASVDITLQRSSWERGREGERGGRERRREGGEAKHEEEKKKRRRGRRRRE